MRSWILLQLVERWAYNCNAVAGGTRGMSLIIKRYIILYVSPSGSWGELWFLYTKEIAQPQLRASSWSQVAQVA